MRRSDDEALSWDGDDDPTLAVGDAPPAPLGEPQPVAEREPLPPADEPKALPDGYTAVGKGSEEVGRVHKDGSVTMPGEREPMGNATLIALGILGGVYLIYAVGWIIGGLRLQGRAEYLVTDIMYQGSFWLAVLAPILWFATVFLLTQHSKAWVRFAWLVAGVALLLPWPFILIGAVGQ